MHLPYRMNTIHKSREGVVCLAWRVWRGVFGVAGVRAADAEHNKITEFRSTSKTSALVTA